jgi:hypothetical protein
MTDRRRINAPVGTTIPPVFISEDEDGVGVVFKPVRTRLPHVSRKMCEPPSLVTRKTTNLSIIYGSKNVAL